MSEKKIEKKVQKKTVARKAEEKRGAAREKAEAKEGKKKEKKEEKKVKSVRISKPAEVKKMQALIKRKKKWHPVFRGRFGQRSIRSKNKDKWNKWRKPPGIDIIRKNEDGALPDTGYIQDRRIRFRHPSGYLTARVNNVKEIEKLSGKKDTAAIIAGGVGTRKRKEIVKKANELGIVVLNRGK